MELPRPNSLKLWLFELEEFVIKSIAPKNQLVLDVIAMVFACLMLGFEPHWRAFVKTSIRPPSAGIVLGIGYTLIAIAILGPSVSNLLRYALSRRGGVSHQILIRAPTMALLATSLIVAFVRSESLYGALLKGASPDFSAAQPFLSFALGSAAAVLFRVANKRLATVITLSGFGSVFFLAASLSDSPIGTAFFFFIPFVMPLFSYLAEHRYSTRNSNGRATDIGLLQPAQFIMPMPFSVFEIDPEARPSEFRTYGLFNVFSGFIYLIIGIALLRFFVSHFSTVIFFDSALSLLTFGSVKYSYYYFFSAASALISVGLIQWTGFNISRPFRAPLLSTTPDERWRDWNTHFQAWLFRFGFFPTLKATNSLAIAIAITFFITFIIHDNIYFISQFNFPRSSFANKSRIHFLFFAAHATLVFISLKFDLHRRVSSWKPSMQWLCVIFMFFLMSAVHILAP